MCKYKTDMVNTGRTAFYAFIWLLSFTGHAGGNNNLSSDCPDYVIEAESLHCDCLRSSASHSTSWPGHSNNSTLYVANVDRDLDGTHYVCRQAAVDGTAAGNFSYTLKVAFRPYILSYTVHETSAYLSAAGREIRKAVLKCVGRGRPAPSMKIYDSAGKKLNSTLSRRQSKTEVEVTAAISDCRLMGQYTCEASNAVSRGLDTRAVFVNVTCPPTSKHPYPVNLVPTVAAGAPLRFTLTANPVPHDFHFASVVNSSTNTSTALRFAAHCQRDSYVPYLAVCSVAVVDAPPGRYKATVASSKGAFGFQFEVVASSTGENALENSNQAGTVAGAVIGAVALAAFAAGVTRVFFWRSCAKRRRSHIQEKRQERMQAAGGEENANSMPLALITHPALFGEDDDLSLYAGITYSSGQLDSTTHLLQCSTDYVCSAGARDVPHREYMNDEADFHSLMSATFTNTATNTTEKSRSQSATCSCESLHSMSDVSGADAEREPVYSNIDLQLVYCIDPID